MDQPPEYPAFKYQYPGAGKISRVRKIISAALLLATPIGFFIFSPLVIVLLIGSAIAFLVRTKKLYIGPRYLLCGTDIVYYANICRLVLSEMNGTLILESTSGKTFVLHREKFPTDARKADKVKRNKEAKFAKVSAKIIEKVQKQAASAEYVGLAPSA